MTAFKNKEVKIFGSSQGIRRNRKGNLVNIFDFKLKSRDRRSCRWMTYDQGYSCGGRPC